MSDGDFKPLTQSLKQGDEEWRNTVLNAKFWCKIGIHDDDMLACMCTSTITCVGTTFLWNTRARTHTRKHLRTHLREHLHPYTATHLHTSTHIHTHIRTHTDTHISHIRTLIITHSHAHTRTHTHTRAHTRTHTHTNSTGTWRVQWSVAARVCGAQVDAGRDWRAPHCRSPLVATWSQDSTCMLGWRNMLEQGEESFVINLVF